MFKKSGLRRVVLGAACAFTMILGACKAHMEVAVNPLEPSVEFDGEWTPGAGEPADPNANPMGTGTITLEGGGTYSGEFFDTDGDGKPDKFKPNEGQGDPDGAFGLTDGNSWFDLERVHDAKGKRGEAHTGGSASKK